MITTETSREREKYEHQKRQHWYKIFYEVFGDFISAAQISSSTSHLLPSLLEVRALDALARINRSPLCLDLKEAELSQLVSFCWA